MKAIWHGTRMAFDLVAVCAVVALVVPLGIVLWVMKTVEHFCGIYED
jgi:hypothetical protein